MWTEPEWLDEDTAIKELTQVTDADELCRRLLASQGGWGTSTRYAEAVDLPAGTTGSSP